MTAKQVYEVRKMMRKGCLYGEIYDRGHNPRAVHALVHHLAHVTAAKAARYIRRHLNKWSTAIAVEKHFRSKGAA
jgi:hypothetical protein